MHALNVTFIFGGVNRSVKVGSDVSDGDVQKVTLAKLVTASRPPTQPLTSNTEGPPFQKSHYLERH